MIALLGKINCSKDECTPKAATFPPSSITDLGPEDETETKESTEERYLSDDVW